GPAAEPFGLNRNEEGLCVPVAARPRGRRVEDVTGGEGGAGRPGRAGSREVEDGTDGEVGAARPSEVGSCQRWLLPRRGVRQRGQPGDALPQPGGSACFAIASLRAGRGGGGRA